MANPEHVAKLKEGVEAFDQWRKNNPEVRPDLSGADLNNTDLTGTDLRAADLAEAGLSRAHLGKANLSGAGLHKADLSRAHLREAKLMWADLREADLSGADLREANLGVADLRKADLGAANLIGSNLREADLSEVDLSDTDLSRADLRDANLGGANLLRADLTEATLAEAILRGADLRQALLSGANLRGVNLRRVLLGEADLSGADLTGADLTGADLSSADLSGADLSGANLSNATLVETDLEEANLTSCYVYGISAWNVRLKGAAQSNLVITPDKESMIQVDNLEVAQFIYLLLNNAKIRDVIDTITSKVVLILGRFTPERKAVLDALREALRKRNYLPILFDFEKPSSQTTVETVSTLAHMARFVIADLTDAKSILQELQAIVPSSPSATVQPLLLASQEEPGMFDFLTPFPWVLQTHRYATKQALLAELDQMVIAPAEAKAKELTRK